MIDPKLLAMLRCPIDGTTLAIATDKLVERFNLQIAAGELRDRVDQKISAPIESALVTTDGKRAYLIRGGIPTLIADESVDLPACRADWPDQ